jgi:hypothetical protein
MPLHRLALLLLCSVSLHSLAAPLSLFSATYVAKFNGIPVEARRELIKVGDGYRVSTLANNVLGEMSQSEEFGLDDAGAIQLKRYHSQQRFFGVAKVEDLIVDPVKNIASYTRNDKRQEIPLAPGYLGPISYQLQLARDLNAKRSSYRYQVLYRGKVKDYRFEPVGEEVVPTSLGAIRTVKVRRVRDDQERETLFWMAPDLGFLLIKLWQREEDGQNYELTLSAATIDGTPISGDKPMKSPVHNP